MWYYVAANKNYKAIYVLKVIKNYETNTRLFWEENKYMHNEEKIKKAIDILKRNGISYSFLNKFTFDFNLNLKLIHIF